MFCLALGEEGGSWLTAPPPLGWLLHLGYPSRVSPASGLLKPSTAAALPLPRRDTLSLVCRRWSALIARSALFWRSTCLSLTDIKVSLAFALPKRRCALPVICAAAWLGNAALECGPPVPSLAAGRPAPHTRCACFCKQTSTPSLRAAQRPFPDPLPPLLLPPSLPAEQAGGPAAAGAGLDAGARRASAAAPPAGLPPHAGRPANHAAGARLTRAARAAPGQLRRCVLVVCVGEWKGHGWVGGCKR